MITLLLPLLLGPARAFAEGDFPPAPVPPPTPDPMVPEDPPRFGSDVAVGVGVGSLLGSWPDPGVHGLAMVRYDAFLVARETPGPRLGLSLWGAMPAWPLQTATEPDGPTRAPFRYTQVGAMTVLRFDPQAPVGGLFGLGFGRTDLDDYYGGPLVLPGLVFEGGARVKLRDPAFLDLLARATWSTSRSPTADALHEWWMVGLAVAPGLHLR